MLQHPQEFLITLSKCIQYLFWNPLHQHLLLWYCLFFLMSQYAKYHHWGFVLRGKVLKKAISFWILTYNQLLFIVTNHQLDPDSPALQEDLQCVSYGLALSQKHQTRHFCCPKPDWDVMNLDFALSFLIQTHVVAATELNSGCTWNSDAKMLFYTLLLYFWKGNLEHTFVGVKFITCNVTLWHKKLSTESSK